MAENPDRFVIIDGVQVSRERAKRKGLLDDNGNVRNAAPTESRARTEASARRGSGGEAPVTAQVGDGAVSTGEDAARAGASDAGTADVASSDAGDAAAVAATGGDDASASTADDAAGAPATDDASSTAADKAKSSPIRRR